jgi:predicted GTPase
VELGPSFKLDGRKVILIDTPGFDDTERSDAEVAKIISAFLEAL